MRTNAIVLAILALYLSVVSIAQRLNPDVAELELNLLTQAPAPPTPLQAPASAPAPAPAPDPASSGDSTSAPITSFVASRTAGLS